MQEILLRGKNAEGRVALVDDDMIDFLSQFCWYFHPRGIGGYAKTSYYAAGPRKKFSIYMHHMVAGQPLNRLQVDHIDRNKLNNQNSNLRIVTQKVNSLNRDNTAFADRSRKPRKRVASGRKISPGYKTSASGFRGVYALPKTSKWQAKIGTASEGNLQVLGYFEDIHDAARAFNEAALARYGELAVLNELP